MKKMTNTPAVIFEIQPGSAPPAITVKHLDLHDVMKIPKESPDVEQIITLTASVKILKTEIVIDLDDVRQLKIEGVVSQNIEYIAKVNDKSVYPVSFILPFITLITLHDDADLKSKFEISGYVSDMLVKQLDNRRIYKNVQLTLNVSPGV